MPRDIDLEMKHEYDAERARKAKEEAAKQLKAAEQEAADQGPWLPSIMKDLYIPYPQSTDDQPFKYPSEIEGQRVKKLASLANRQYKDESLLDKGIRKFQEFIHYVPKNMEDKILQTKQDVIFGQNADQAKQEELYKKGIIADKNKEYNKLMNNDTPGIEDDDNQVWTLGTSKLQNIAKTQPAIYGYVSTPFQTGEAQEIDATGTNSRPRSTFYIKPTMSPEHKEATTFHEFGHFNAPNFDERVDQTTFIPYGGLFSDKEVRNSFGLVNHPAKDINNINYDPYFDSASEYLTRYFTPLKYQAAAKYGFVPTDPDEAHKLIQRIKIDKNFQNQAAEEIWKYNKFEDAYINNYKDKYNKDPAQKDIDIYKRNWLEGFKSNIKNLNPNDTTLQKILLYVTKADSKKQFA
jgi:hypothetical protein